MAEAVYSDSLVIVRREMIDYLPDPGPFEEKKILSKMASMTHMAHMTRTMSRMVRWLADLADPSFSYRLKMRLLASLTL